MSAVGLYVHLCRLRTEMIAVRACPRSVRVMFTVDDIDETLEKLRKRSAQLVGEVVQYQDAYRLCYIRGPEGLLIGLAQELG
jgi:predicted enzyme related to lactoylglutathione lyase